MRASLSRSITSAVLVLTSVVSWSAPAWALRAAGVEDEGQKKKLELALQTDAPATWTWSTSPMPISVEQRSDLLLAAKANTKGAFDLGRAVAVAGHGKNPRIPKEWKEVSDYLESVLEKELAELIGNGGALASDPVLRQSPLLALGKPVSTLDWIRKNVRFVAVNDDENGYLASQGVEATDSHTAVVAYAGWFPYPRWETGLSPNIVAAIKSGTRARLQNQPLRPDELPGPASVYLSRTQIQEFMKNGADGRQALAIKLAHEVKDVLRQGRHEDETPALTQQVNGLLTQQMQGIQAARQQKQKARQDREARKLTKLHVTADLSGLLTRPASADQRRQITQRVEKTLEGLQKEGLIFGFNVHLYSQGKLMLVDMDYREGGEPVRKASAISAVKMALRRGVLEAQSIGLAPQGSDVELLSKVRIHSGENRFTQRPSEPFVSVQALGLGMGAFNRVIWNLLTADVGHLQAIAGDRGFRVTVANLSDIRAGKEKYRVHEFEVPGLSEVGMQRLIKKIQANEITEEDLKDAAAQNLYALHRLIGAMDEYAIEGVYALPGSKFADKQGEDLVTLTDEPIIKIHLHEQPVGEFRAQSGGWATGSYQKVLTLPYFAPNAAQTRWVGWIPVTEEEAEDPSVLEKEGWPVEEMGLMVASAWSYDRGGEGRGEPPVTDVMGKNDQAEINREVLKPLMEVWKQLGNFEPRLTAEEAARIASAAAAQFPFFSEKPKEAEPVVRTWTPIPDLKKEEVDTVVSRFQGDGKLTWSFFKADIGGKAGHDQVLQTHMAAARAKLEQAKEQGLIQDYKVFFVGDDMQLAILHKKGVQSQEMHALAWAVFSFGVWVTRTIKLEPYGHAQDIKVAKLFGEFPVEHHAQLTRRAVELLKADFERAAAGNADVPAELKKNARLALSSALKKWAFLEKSLSNWESGATGTIMKEAVSVGNVTGMGIGWAEQPAEEGVELAYYGKDKSGAGGFNIRLASMLSDALAAGDLRQTDIVEMWDVEQHRRIFLQVGKDIDSILAMAAQVNKYNFKRILDGENGNIIGWLSSEILAQTAHGYVGKDDPILVMVKRVGRHVATTFSDPIRAATAQLGDEAGSHQLANVIRAWWSSFPGEKSNPVGTAITFRIKDGKIEMEDEGGKPEFDEGRKAAERFNREFERVQGEFSPLVANRKQIEETYSRARLLELADKNPTAWVDHVDFMAAAGLEGEVFSLTPDSTSTEPLVMDEGVVSFSGLSFSRRNERDEAKNIQQLSQLLGVPAGNHLFLIYPKEPQLLYGNSFAVTDKRTRAVLVGKEAQRWWAEFAERSSTVSADLPVANAEDLGWEIKITPSLHNRPPSLNDPLQMSVQSLPKAAGLEAQTELVERVVASGRLGVLQQENGRRFAVVPVSASQEPVAMELLVQAGLEAPQGIPQTVMMRTYPVNLEDALRMLANNPPLNGAVFLLNNQVVSRQTVKEWVPAGDYRPVLADPRISGQTLGQVLLQIVALADWARKNGQVFEINSVDIIQTQQGTFAIIQAA